MSSAINTILADVNLSTLSFSDNGRILTVEFLNMADGSPCAQLTAIGVVAFNFHNTFDDDDDALPAYVGEVTCQDLEAQEAASLLSRLGYGFLGRGVTPYAPKSARLHMHLEGGEVTIDVICSEYALSHRNM